MVQIDGTIFPEPIGTVSDTFVIKQVNNIDGVDVGTCKTVSAVYITGSTINVT